MDAFKAQVNDLLKEVYWNILKVQEDFVRRIGRADISMGEMHIIEIVGNSMVTEANGQLTCEGSLNGCRISDIAAEMGITLPSVTVAINKLIKKNCVTKVRSVDDARCVLAVLTDFGMEIYQRHQRFHHKMIDDVTDALDDGEKAVMLKCFSRLNTFFKEKIIQESK